MAEVDLMASDGPQPMANLELETIDNAQIVVEPDGAEVKAHVVIGVQAQDVGQHITPGPASSTLTGVRQPREPGVPAAAWDHRADHSAWYRVPDTAGTPSLAGGAGAVVVELLPAAAGAVGRDSRRWLAFVLLACALVCFNRLESAKGE
jgi:hypothetical protein